MPSQSSSTPGEDLKSAEDLKLSSMNAEKGFFAAKSGLKSADDSSCSSFHIGRSNSKNSYSSSSRNLAATLNKKTTPKTAFDSVFAGSSKIPPQPREKNFKTGLPKKTRNSSTKSPGGFNGTQSKSCFPGVDTEIVNAQNGAAVNKNFSEARHNAPGGLANGEESEADVQLEVVFAKQRILLNVFESGVDTTKFGVLTSKKIWKIV